MTVIPAVDRALRVLELMARERSSLTLTDIARRTEIPVASCHAILNTLEAKGYASRTVIGRSHYWSPTLSMYHLGAEVVNRLGVTDGAEEYLRTLAEAVGCPAHIGVLEGGNVMYIAKVPAPVFIQFDTYAGKASPFHITALGRAIAAFLPQERRDALLVGLPEQISAELDATRERGYALEEGEELPEVGCIAAPIHDARGEVRASVGITGFTADIVAANQAASAHAVLEAASAISAGLGYTPRPVLPVS